MQQATKQPAVLLVHDYYQVPGGEDVVVANEKHLLDCLLYTSPSPRD